MKRIKAGIIGATGYVGIELVRLLLTHPQVELAAISSVSFEGKLLEEVYPNMTGLFAEKLCNEDAVIEKSEAVFACLPHGLSQEIAEKCYKAGKVVIDLGADFRLHSEADYKEWYGGEFLDEALHKEAVYALPELFRADIKGKRVISNPGCYPTATALGLAPLLKAGAVETKGIVIDAKSGVTGAGRGMTQRTHYPDCNESFEPYKVAAHRHTPEIEQTLSILAGEKLTVTFVPHLLPVNRGIIATIYAMDAAGLDAEKLHKLYSDFYKDEQFVRLMPLGETANLKNVRLSNYCDISVHYDARCGRVVIVSAIDNMVKGAAGQAVQNLNIAFDLPEQTGLQIVPPAF